MSTRLDEQPWAGFLEKPIRVRKAPKPLRSVNPERRARLHERNFGAHGDFIRLQSCVIQEHVHPNLRTPCHGPVECAHLHPRQMGGCGGDRFSTFPACSGHHREQEGNTAAFQERYGLDLAILVEVYNLRDSGLTDEERESARLRLVTLKEPR